MNYAHLNHDLTSAEDSYSDAWRRVLGRLGDYAMIIVRALNLRPDAVTLFAQTATHLLLRITTRGTHVILRIAPEVDLTGEVFFGRAMETQRLPAARIIQHDLTCATVPFAYTLESYVCGISAADIEAPHLLRAAARQAGRTLRRMHRVSAPGWGRPGPRGRWATSDWRAVLARLHTTLAPAPFDAMVFDDNARLAIAGLLEHPALVPAQPVLTHGAPGPQAVRCTIGEHVQLEALVDPGASVGGDGLFDLAWGLDPAYPAEWRAGLLEGYVALAPLSAAERERLQFLQTLTAYWQACARYARALPYEAARDQVLALLAVIMSSSSVSLALPASGEP